MRLVFISLAALCCAVCAVASPIWWLGPGQQLSDSLSLQEAYPDVNRLGHVTWQANLPVSSNPDTWYFDGRTTRNLSNTAGYGEEHPQINNSDQIAWKSAYSILLWENGITSTLVYDFAFDFGYPQISDSGKVVWSRGNPGDIFLWDGGSTTRITNTISVNDINPRLNDAGQVVWSGNTDVMFWDTSTVTNLSNTPAYNEWSGQINSSGLVMWAGPPAGSSTGNEVWMNYGMGNINITNTPTIGESSAVVNDWWHAAWFGGGGVWFWDGGSATKVFTSPTTRWNSDLQINEYGQMVWVGGLTPTGYDTAIHFYDGKDRVYLIPGSQPNISGSWITYKGPDGEIYRTLIPEPGTLALVGFGLAALLCVMRRRAG